MFRAIAYGAIGFVLGLIADVFVTTNFILVLLVALLGMGLGVYLARRMNATDAAQPDTNSTWRFSQKQGASMAIVGIVGGIAILWLSGQL